MHSNNWHITFHLKKSRSFFRIHWRTSNVNMHNSEPSTFKPFHPCGWCHLKINHPSLHTLKKYVSGPSFSLLHGSWLCQDPFSHFSHLTNYPYRWCHPEINHPSLHAWKNMPLDQVSVSYMAPGSIRSHFPILATKQPTPVDGAIQKYTTPVFTHWKIYLWTKFQPPTWLLAPSGSIFVFWPENNLPLWWCHVIKINHPSLQA